MIINRGEVAGIEYLEDRPEAILFVLENGAYFYVEQGIVENELRVMGNWKISAAPLTGRQWAIVYSQGDEIPKELGDYLVASHEDSDYIIHAKKMFPDGLDFDKCVPGKSYYVTCDQKAPTCDELNARVTIVKQGNIDIKSPYETCVENEAFDEGVIAGVFECGEILSRPLPVHKENNHSTGSSKETDD